MSPVELTLIMFLSMLVLMLLGLPVTFCLGTVGALTTLILWGPHALNVMYFALMSVSSNIILTAVPLFIFMGFMLHYAGIAGDLFDTIYKWAGGVRGALGAGTVIICAFIAAMIGLSGPTVLSLGVLVVPAMIARGYNKRLSLGTVMSGGALGFLIPPSMMMIMYGFLSDASVGRLFAAGVLPGLMLSGIYIVYIFIRCALRPEDGPALAPENRAPWPEKFKALRFVIFPALLAVGILSAIFFGVASPTEAAAMGAGFSIICAAVHGRLTTKILVTTCRETMKITGFVGFITICAILYSKTYTALGANAMIRQIVLDIGASPWAILIVMQLSFFALGMFLDDIAILFLCMPIYLPIVKALDFDLVWFGILYVLNMQMAYLTPPYGLNLFYMKAVAPPSVHIKDIYLAVVPFLLLQLVMLISVMLFPQIALFLPNLLFG